ncbi:hypothetical protein [Paludisphaera rhizosphaerae]|uniref:hypothetical protein n=1 Tax=Paludisphaera rhizosphaerae TaxID=2711216 RepID=UPI00198117B9|nr:hypothetical protein [Paludisphaera rhizosphaerae]
MNSIVLVSVMTAAGIAAVAAFATWILRRRHLDRWLVTYLIQAPKRRAPTSNEPIHLLLCIADHFEPRGGGVTPEVACERVRCWTESYQHVFGSFRDSDGRPPRHTFFFPLEEYDPEHLDLLSELCRAGYGEIEVHLHHDGETAASLRRRLLDFKKTLADRHGLLARDRDTGALAYGFIHGNWALDNARPDGRWCGVNNELDILRETGCYADFTLPSAPHPTQTRKINSIYYAVDDPHRPKSHDSGRDVGQGGPPRGALLLIQGPLLLDWGRRKWGLLPRIENGCIQASQPPDARRVDLWLRARVQVPTRPDWFFVKLHTHGATEENRRVLLGPPTVEFHRDLERRTRRDPNFHFHYVTARELYNLIRAAESGWSGSVAEALDYHLTWDAGRAAAGRSDGTLAAL